MRLYTAAASLFGLFLVPFAVSALGLGDISLNSALNEPFAAEIPVESVQQADLDSLTVNLASADTFDRYGLDRPAFLGDIRFEVVEKANGQAVLSLSSSMPVAEPFVTMLLDVRWSSGRLLREYTVLLDPPLFEANVVQPAATPAQSAATTSSPAAGEVTRSPEPVVTEVIEPTGLFQTPPASETAAVIVAVPEPVSEPEPEPVPEAPVEMEPEPLAVAAIEEQSADIAPVYNTPFEEPASPTIPESYTTQRGDTLWRISERVRAGSGLSNNQMMLALYRANPDAFLGNINQLKAGAILRIPDSVELGAPGVSEATSEVLEQHAAWSGTRSQESRLQLVAPSGTDDSASSAATDTSVGFDESAESDADATAGTAGDLDVAADESQRLLQIEDAEMQALQERVEAQEQAATDTPDTADAAESGEQIFADTETLPESDGLAEDVVEADVSAQQGSEEPAVPAPGSVGAAPKEESSFLGGIFTSIWFWGAVAIVLLLAMTFGRKGKKTEPEDVTATGSDWAADIAEPALDPDATVKDFGELESTGSIVVEEADPAIISDDPDAALDEGFEIADEEEIGTDNSLLGSADESVDDPFGASFAAPDDESEDVLGDDLDFRIDPNDAFAEPESLDDSQSDDLVSQEAAGQDEVELPLEKTISTGAPLNLDQADPIAEAEFHMAYGLYDQAADLLERALEDEPDNKPYRVKLIEVFFVWENKEGFLAQARALRSSVSEDTDSDWNKVLILGKQLCPDDELFSGVDAAAPSADAMDLELSDVGETEIDFTLGGSEVQVLNLDVDLSADDDEANEGLDFDFGSETDGAETDGDLTLNLDSDTDNDFDSPAADTLALDSADIGLGLGDADSVDDDSGMESATIENPLVSPDQELADSDATMESDTLESSVEGETIENPLVSPDQELADNDATMESDTLESSVEGETLESPTLDALGANAETTEMPGLEDPSSLEVDLSGLTDLPIESGDLDSPELTDIDASETSDDEVYSEAQDEGGEADISEEAAGPVFGDDDSRMSPETENIRLGDEDETVFASFEELGKVAGDTEQNNAEDEPDSDTLEQPSVEAVSGDTAEQPALDLDLSDTELPEESVESLSGEDESWSLPEDATMTEVGTKLDLARAYIDMGDPDGARSILNEVLDEGVNTQQQEARQLLAELDD